MNISNSIPSTVSSISFSFLSAQDIRRISVKQLTNPVLLDDLNRPNLGGLYDPALGPSDRRDLWVITYFALESHSPKNVRCATCRLNYFQCPGHFGHIELPSPVFHPLFMTNAYNLLRASCLYCHKFKVRRTVVRISAVRLRIAKLNMMYFTDPQVHRQVDLIGSWVIGRRKINWWVATANKYEGGGWWGRGGGRWIGRGFHQKN